jgi:hypothetical protein
MKLLIKETFEEIVLYSKPINEIARTEAQGRKKKAVIKMFQALGKEMKLATIIVLNYSRNLL